MMVQYRAMTTVAFGTSLMLHDNMADERQVRVLTVSNEISCWSTK